MSVTPDRQTGFQPPAPSRTAPPAGFEPRRTRRRPGPDGALRPDRAGRLSAPRDRPPARRPRPAVVGKLPFRGGGMTIKAPRRRRPRRIPFRLSGYTSGSSAVIRPRDGRSRAPDRRMPAPRDRGCRVVRMAGSGRLPSGRSEAEPATRARRGHFERNAPMPDHQTGCSPHSRMWPDR